MDRLGTFEFNGVTYPTLASARAIMAYCNKCNLKLAQAFEGFDGENVEVTLFMLSELLKAGYVWQKRNGGEAITPPSFDDLMDFIGLSDLPRATMCVIETMAKSLATQIQVKNAETSPEVNLGNN